MISFEIAVDRILFKLSWENMQGFREITLSRPPTTSELNLDLVCSETVITCNQFAFLTRTHRVNALKRMLSFATQNGMEVPGRGSPGWKRFVNEHYIHHLSHPEKLNASGDKILETLRMEWRQSIYLYRNLKQRHVIPLNVLIPAIKKPRIPDDEGSSDVLDSVEETLWPLTDTNHLWPKTYLVDKTLNVSTDIFLEKLQSDLENRTLTIVTACEKYWNKVIICQSIGENLIKSISTEEIERVLASGVFYVNHRYIADANNPDGAAWFLAMLDHFFLRTDELKTISFPAMKNIPFFGPFCSNGYMRARMSDKLREIAGENAAPTENINETLNRLLGHLSARDCGAAAAILTAENPKFTPHSLRRADYLSQDNKPIHYYNSELGRLMWSVSKPRAKARKASALPPLSQKIYTQLVKATMKSRLRLMLDGDPNYRKLFLTSTFKWVGLSSNLDQILTTTLGVCLYKVLESALRDRDVSKEIFSLKRIRGSQAMISFLKEGTYQAAANTLGNSISVVMKRYIPKWLKQRWNVRILRTFQTKLIILATKGRPWHLAASDFLTENDLFQFIIREAAVSVASDPMSIDLKRYAAELTEDAVNHIVKPLTMHKMVLKLDSGTLAAVFLLAELRANASSNEHMDSKTGINDNFVITLARLLNCTYDTSMSADADNAIAGNIAGLSIPHFQAVYLEARKIKSEWENKVITATTLTT